MSDSIRVLLADDHPIVRHGLSTLIGSEIGMEVVAQASNGEEAVALVRQHRPDVIMLDIMMPHLDGLGAIHEIKKEFPDARILVITSFADEDKIFPAIKIGALGYLLKDSSPQQVLDSIRAVHLGQASLHPTIALKLMQELHKPEESRSSPVDPLTQREIEVLRLVAQGLTNQEIAEQFVISERTVGNHIGNILTKLHLANRTQAALFALREGLVDISDTLNE